MSSHSGDNHKSADLVYKLVCHIIRKPTDSVKAEYRNALQMLNCAYDNYDTNEFSICEKIKEKFMIENRVKDAVKFVELHRNLQTSAVLQNRARVLYFLHCLQGSDNEKFCNFSNGVSGRISLDPEITLNTHDIINKQINKTRTNTVELGNLLIKTQNKELFTPDSHFAPSKLGGKDNLESAQNRVAHVAALFSTNTDRQSTAQSNIKREHPQEKALTTRSEESNLGSICLTVPNMKPLLRDILYAVQGLKGDVISWDPDKNNFNVVFKEDFPNPVKRLTLRFIELGWMYCRINQYCKTQRSEMSLGLIAQSFIAALNEKLVTYYKLIAELEAFLTQETTLESLYDHSNSLTLHRLSVWFFEPHTQLKVLASVVDACKGEKRRSTCFCSLFTSATW